MAHALGIVAVCGGLIILLRLPKILDALIAYLNAAAACAG